LKRYRVIDPEGKGPVSAVEITGPPTTHLAKQIAARAIEGITPGQTRDEVLRTLTARLVAKPMGDEFHRWVVNRLHASFEESEDWVFDDDEIQIEEFSADGLVVSFHPVDHNTGTACIFPERRILITARAI
jgi:hypothetical protein